MLIVGYIIAGLIFLLVADDKDVRGSYSCPARKFYKLVKSEKPTITYWSKQMKGMYDQHIKAYKHKKRELIKSINNYKKAKI